MQKVENNELVSFQIDIWAEQLQEWMINQHFKHCTGEKKGGAVMTALKFGNKPSYGILLAQRLVSLG